MAAAFKLFEPGQLTCRRLTIVSDFSPYGFAVRADHGLWRLLPQMPVRLNGALLIHGEPVLHHGDAIADPRATLIFVDQPEAHGLEAQAMVESWPRDSGPWKVWADALTDAGDPLGERVTHALSGVRLKNEPWTEGIWRDEQTGGVELGWRNGLIERAVIRAAYHLPLGALETRIARVLSLRAAVLLRDLTVDLPGNLPRERPPDFETWRERIRAVRDLPVLWLGEEHPPPSLHLEQVIDRASVTGLNPAQPLVLAGTLNFAWSGSALAVQPGDRDRRAYAVLVRIDGRWQLHPGPLRDSLKVNGSKGMVHYLIPGDRLSFGGGAVTIRFDVG